MFSKILIANRGEIALRVIRTCKKLGIYTVAVYSEADAESPHTKAANESFLIGGPLVKESYLNIEKIIETAKEAEVDAIHPGYGLLSENADFAKRCKDEGIAFIGPSPNVISRMGRKVEARKAVKEAGIPVVPGITYPLRNVEEAVKAASQIGYPIMLKASSGGGGIGMQLVFNDEELKKVYPGLQKRAADFFGDGAMYIEKYINNPRHIEVQILADSKGNTVYLWERECSIQRRHQKVIEEAPSLFLDEETRQKLGKAAVKAAQLIDYVNAGTIEFLVDENKNFYFLEMNTRLQVEHPITEEITGLDLVEQQIRIASGEVLSFSQSDVQKNGHAIEARIYAEDPFTFFPSPGKITKLVLPTYEWVRHEAGVVEGSLVTPFYDPMIAKLIVIGKNREEAISRFKKVLAEYKVEGIKTNIPMLQKVAAHEAYRKGDTTIDFIHKYIKG